MEEVWKEISEYEGLYEVSNKGKVRSLRRNIIMKTFIINSGYETVKLYKERKHKSFLVHRLVAREFCRGYDESLDINHKDADRLNNQSDNLEWVTRKENIRDSMKRGTHCYKKAHKVAHIKRRKPVIITNLKKGYSKKFESARKASLYIGIHENNVSRVARGERRSTGGYLVKYIREDDIV